MAEWLSKKNIIILSVLLFGAPIFAIDLNEFQDFSSRSLIMQKMNGKNALNQELRDLMKEKKLYPKVDCLIEQIKKNKIENVEILLKAGIGPNVSYYADYPLYYATKYKRREIAKLLVQYGAKVDRGFYSELYLAVKNKDEELAKLYLDMGANVNYMDSVTNETVLYWALKRKMKDIVPILIEKGVRPDRKSAKMLRKSVYADYFN